MNTTHPKLQELLQHERNLPFCETTFGKTKLRFAITNPKCYYFAESLKHREPDTNEWISRIKPDDIFFDVGSNNCVFGIIASAVYGAKTYAFEPHFASYYISQKNIFANKLEGIVHLYPLAVSDATSLSSLFLSSTTAGKSLNNFGQSRPAQDALWNATTPQSAVSMSLDDICQHLNITPNYLKIDVDGIESKIISGAEQILANPLLTDIMVEFNSKEKSDVLAAEKIIDAGFRLDSTGPSGYFFRRTNA